MARLEGRNAVAEALRAEREIEKLLISGKEGSIQKIIAKARERQIPVEFVARERLNSLSQTGAHQGVIAFVSETEYSSVEEILSAAQEKGEAPFLLILDGICDPHNLGAILRTADAAGVHGVILPKRRSVGITETVMKSSAGAANHVKIARVSNLVRTVEELQKQGIWFYAAHQDGTVRYDEADWSGGVGLVIGSEGFGVSDLLLKKCDYLVSIPMRGKVNSLNASVAAGILMYAVKK